MRLTRPMLNPSTGPVPEPAMMIHFTSTFLPPLLLLLLLQQSPPPVAMAASADLICKTCKQSADSDPNMNYTFCVEALRSDPASEGADFPGLAIIASRLAIGNATRAESRVRALLKDKRLGRYKRSCLEVCGELYSGAVRYLSDTIDMIRSGSYVDANARVSAALNAPVDCEDSFQEGGLASPLAKEDYDLVQLGVIAINIIARLR